MDWLLATPQHKTSKVSLVLFVIDCPLQQPTNLSLPALIPTAVGAAG
jgi:hypothetical protein